MIMTGRQRELLRVSVLASLAYFAAAPPLIYQFGTIGAAIAVCLVFGTYNILVTVLAKRRIGVWTAASLSPQAVLEVVDRLREKRLGRAP
jgi:O-antigen/teichoic acid export membrane protein